MLIPARTDKKTTMKSCFQTAKWLALPVAILSLSSQPSRALTYNIDNSDLMLCFRLTTQLGASYVVEVDLGSVQNYLSMPIGTSTNLTPAFYTPSQLDDAFANVNGGAGNYANVVFSAFACDYDTAFSYPDQLYTYWVTDPRVNPAVQTTPFARQNRTATSGLTTQIDTVGIDVGNSSQGYSPTHSAGADNTSTACLIPTGLSDDYTSQVKSGNFGGDSPISVENVSPDPFNSPIVSDFYISVATTFQDPFANNSTTGSADLVGYFTFNPDGSTDFTRAVPRPNLTITQTNDVNTITFKTASTATYYLAYTNEAGLSAPLSTWPTSPTTITGDSTVHHFTDTTTDPNRFYVVIAR
jgi:hypothetical protein